MSEKLTLYEYTHSGNSYKVLLTAELLHIPLRRVFVDIVKGESRTEEFLAMNPAGQVPLLRLADGSFLSQSHAIIWYLASGSHLIPTDRTALASVLQWMSFEQYNLEPSIGVLRYKIYSAGMSKQELSDIYDGLFEKGHAALGVLELALTHSSFLVEERFTLADIALFGYTHCTEQSSLSLEDYPNIRRWLERVKSIENFASLESFLQ